MRQVVVIDDDEHMRGALEVAIRKAGFKVRAFDSGEMALEFLKSEPVHAIITDLRMPGMNGMQVLESAARISPGVPVVMITAYGTVGSAVEAMKKGAFDFIQKPFDVDQVEVVVRKAVEHYELVRENEFLKAELGNRRTVDFVLGKSAVMGKVFEMVEKVAGSTSTVLITGESGTGKEVVARAIHARSPRSQRPFLCVNCAALSAGLLESELFGHEKGAFTGAERMRKGRFELADGGTLLLDEVSEINLELQAKLLRVLQEREFERVGSSVTRRVDVRVIATTNRDLKKEISNGRFREDLYFRLNVVCINVPPLRERKEDIEDLAKHFISKYAARTGGGERRLHPKTLELLMGYDWPGNVRELENILERAMVLNQGGEILPEHIAPGLEKPVRQCSDLASAVRDMTIEEVEKIVVKAALERFSGNRVRAAEALGISRRTLIEKIKRWGL